MIPQNYDSWKHCITQLCKLELIPQFVQQRLAVYQDNHHEETKKFISLYGHAHLSNIIKWLFQAQNEITS